eukprot:TRINITY_DN36536_c0_g1_i1.p1 TRINITY_DN36536_c0_g1~~TRINITY_DN36536_c0_g1_i1.p1  ORF type:complete len:112 (-),score=32.85 TRINITY_DN36536_c0_g1_i1:14-349(-)
MTADAEDEISQPNLAKQPQTANMFCSPRSSIHGFSGHKPAREQGQLLEMQDVGALSRSLDDLLVMRNAELVRSIEEQQDRFLFSVREAMLQQALGGLASQRCEEGDQGVFQ